MAGAVITIDDVAVINALAHVIAMAGDTRAVTANIGEHIRATTIDRIKKQQSPDGKAFVPLHPLYAQTKKGPGILRGQSGDLAQIVYQLASDSEVEIGSNAIYAAIHQFGGTIKPKSAAALAFSMGGKTFKLKSVKIPARPYLGLSAADEAEILAIMSDYFAEAFDAGTGS